VPNGFKPVHTVAYWDEFGFPEKPPHYGFPVVETWWHEDAADVKKNG
jgi:microcin C transport system substrate-binding protein